MANVVTTSAEAPPLPGAANTSEQKKPAVTTLGAWGAQLPVGVLRDGALHRPFAFARWNTRVERELDEMKRAHKGALKNAEWTTMVLAKMLTRFGPYDFAALSDAERRIALSQAWMVDVMYALLWLRMGALGPDVRFDMKCPACGHAYRPTADLSGVSVTVPGGPSDLTRIFTFRDPLTINGREYRQAVIDPPRWQSMLSAPGGAVESAPISIAVGSIRHMVDGESTAAVPVEVVDEISKYDLEHLRAFVDADHFGPDMELTSECPACRFEAQHGIDWRWDFFFKAASL